MWTVKTPANSAEEVVRACAQGLKNGALAARLRDEIETLGKNSVVYQGVAQDSQCHSLTVDSFKTGALSDGDMKWLYEQRLVGSVPGKQIYHAILRNAPHGLCAYCQYGIAKTLDHFVPKATVPALAIEPWNLIPCCKDCNHELGRGFGTTQDEEFLHPYFMPNIGRWLFASVIRTTPVALEFFPDPPKSLSVSLRQRVINQFSALNLALIYASVSASNLVQAASRAQRLADPDAIREHFQESAEDAAVVGANSWRAAMFEALAASEWYCNGGYALGFDR